MGRKRREENAARSRAREKTAVTQVTRKTKTKTKTRARTRTKQKTKTKTTTKKKKKASTPLTAEQIDEVRTTLARKCKSSQRLAKGFPKLDKDGSGGLSKKEFKQLVKAAAKTDKSLLTSASLNQLWAAVWASQPAGGGGGGGGGGSSADPEVGEVTCSMLQGWFFGR